MQIRIRASVLERKKRRRKEGLAIETFQERERIPDFGQMLIIESIGIAPRACYFEVVYKVSRWKADGTEEYEVWLGGAHEDLILLALTSGWKVTQGIEELSPDQRSLVECEAGTCGHSHAT
jgi:hypothetical protein